MSSDHPLPPPPPYSLLGTLLLLLEDRGRGVVTPPDHPQWARPSHDAKRGRRGYGVEVGLETRGARPSTSDEQRGGEPFLPYFLAIRPPSDWKMIYEIFLSFFVYFSVYLFVDISDFF